ncbi:transcriptional regulator, AraC family with amidase-like domain [Nocardioides sp. YR527]|uniref:GlxA family transcriptional regulator n=1 Tax=Nocardioides sp. YR527 TaxID=1881028 RepID=UPI000888E533|nr:helix-turn-helix domain-containing protein [Nocardioides sp. YR527]SDK65280.1 transcriptional regulator, AraC family with amidase-like domain [Nocardioides sp. YR527]
MHRIAVLAFDGVHSMDLAMPLQVFSTAHSRDKEPGELFGARLYDVRVCGDGSELAVCGVDDVEMYRFTPPHPLEAALEADTIVATGTPRELSAEALRLLGEAHRRGIRIASLGTRIIVASGLLDGRRTATHWSRAHDLAVLYPRVEVDADVLFVDHGDVITSAGAASGIDMCLHLVRVDHGAAVAADVARHMVVPMQRDGEQAPYIRHDEPADDHGSLQTTLLWLRERLEERTTLAEIAAHAGMSLSTLNRRFKEQTRSTPLQWLLRERVRHAQELLESTDLSIEEIAHHCGFGSAVAMRQQFAKMFGISPSDCRRTFRATLRPVLSPIP